MLERTGHADDVGGPVAPAEYVARARHIGDPLPASYAAVINAVSQIGGTEKLLDSDAIASAAEKVVRAAGSGNRYIPFAHRAPDTWLCFDRDKCGPDGEPSIVEWVNKTVAPAGAHFGEWLDSVADEREARVDQAASLPASLKRLLDQLGFEFKDPIVGRLESADIAAIESLVGEDVVHAVRGTENRLFDSSGKASLTLNLDDFTIACSLRTGIYMIEPEDVFRWLRVFRDENFFGPPRTGPPPLPDSVRDLRKAPREPPVVRRGVVEVDSLPASRHAFRGASGPSARDFYVLGRTRSTSPRAPSLILRVQDGEITDAHTVDEPLVDLHVTDAGTLWALSVNGTAIRLGDPAPAAFPLERPTPGRASWIGIGGTGERVLVWGAGALMTFNGEGMVPFAPDAELDPREAIVALQAYGECVDMLVTGDHVGAVAHYDGRKWRPVREDHVIEGKLIALDTWRRHTLVLTRDGRVYRVDRGVPQPLHWDRRQDAFLTDARDPRPMTALCAYDGGVLVGSSGGVLDVVRPSALFHALRGTHEPTRLVRIGPRDGQPRAQDASSGSGIVVLSGGHVLVHEGGEIRVIDVHRW